MYNILDAGDNKGRFKKGDELHVKFPNSVNFYIFTVRPSPALLKPIIMKYLLSLLLVSALLGCIKKEDPCDDIMVDPVQYSPLVFSFIDADSTNLLINKTIDPAEILIKDDQGNLQKFEVFMDSTNTKARYISVPLLKKEGTNTLIITAGNRETSLKYDFKTIKEPCYTYYNYENYVLNSNPYQLKLIRSYYMRENVKLETNFRIIYITQ